tara:strand:+ start:2093 stop:2410 length:318 start_codon:yes stop_codon:yes gene_type:complete
MVKKAIQDYKKEEEVQLLKDSKLEQEKILAEAHKEIEKEADLKKHQEEMKIAIEKVKAEFKAEEDKEAKKRDSELKKERESSSAKIQNLVTQKEKLVSAELTKMK